MAIVHSALSSLPRPTIKCIYHWQSNSDKKNSWHVSAATHTHALAVHVPWHSMRLQNAFRIVFERGQLILSYIIFYSIIGARVRVSIHCVQEIYFAAHAFHLAFFSLSILFFIEPTAAILNAPDLYVDKGSTINLTCTIRFGREPPGFIFWYHEDKVCSKSFLNCVRRRDYRSTVLAWAG